jgi:3-keto-disaccharide hydrolase
MKTFSPFRIAAILTISCSLALSAAEKPADAKPNALTAAEKAAGWKLLFDGKTIKGWRSFKKDTFPDHGWTVADGWLKCIAGGHGGDVISTDEFNDFELTWDWRLPPKANNGVKYFVTESRDRALGHEYQMVDGAEEGDPIHSTAAFYDVLPPKPDKPLKPAGEINHSRVIVRGNHVEHWLNGAKVLEYELGSDEVKAAVAKSKFKNVEGFGTKIKGHILLTYHNDECLFRNIKICEPVTK